jgi:hypothetical protein
LKGKLLLFMPLIRSNAHVMVLSQKCANLNPDKKRDMKDQELVSSVQAWPVGMAQ